MFGLDTASRIRLLFPFGMERVRVNFRPDSVRALFTFLRHLRSENKLYQFHSTYKYKKANIWLIVG